MQCFGFDSSLLVLEQRGYTLGQPGYQTIHLTSLHIPCKLTDELITTLETAVLNLLDFFYLFVFRKKSFSLCFYFIHSEL